MWICRTTTMTLDGTLVPQARGTLEGHLRQKERRRKPREAKGEAGRMFLTWGHGDRGGEVSASMIGTESDGCTGGTGTRRIWQGRKERVRNPPLAWGLGGAAGWQVLWYRTSTTKSDRAD